MLNIFETGDESFRLVDQRDVNVGWVRGSALGFDGFASEREAIDAAVAGGDALAAYVERLTGALPSADAAARPRIARQDGEEWVVRGEERLARLFRAGADDGLDRRAETFGVEFALPTYLKPGAAISAAQLVNRAIRAADIAPAAKPAAKPAARVASAAATPLPFSGGAPGGALHGDGPAAGDVVPAR